jgi:NAD(P)H-dependent FMN reductase
VCMNLSTSYRSAPSVVVVGLSPRIGASHQACEAASVLLIERGADVSFRSTVGMPLVAAGLEDVNGYTYPATVSDLVAELSLADGVVLGAAIHRAAVAGISRNWVEVLRTGLAGKPILPIVAAGSIRAQLAAEAFRTDLWQNFDARPLSPVVVTYQDTKVKERLVRSVDGLVAALGPRAAGVNALAAEVAAR